MHYNNTVKNTCVNLEKTKVVAYETGGILSGSGSDIVEIILLNELLFIKVYSQEMYQGINTNSRGRLSIYFVS